MAKYIAIGSALIGLALGFRGIYVWTSCAYDCPALSNPGLTATGCILVALLAFVIGFGVFLGTFFGSCANRG